MKDFYPDVLPKAQREVLEALGEPVTAQGFYLAGGTALALQLGHRQSIDFDWFRREAIDDPLLLARDLSAAVEDFEVTSTSRNTLHAKANGVLLSWFSYDYPQLEELVEWPDVHCQLACLADIAAMKIAAVAQRGSKKDFFDLVALGESGFHLDSMLTAYRSKYSIQDIGHVLMSLTWFEDAEADPAPIIESQTTWTEVKAKLLDWTLDLTRE